MAGGCSSERRPRPTLALLSVLIIPRRVPGCTFRRPSWEAEEPEVFCDEARLRSAEGRVLNLSSLQGEDPEGELRDPPPTTERSRPGLLYPCRGTCSSRKGRW